MPIEYDHYYDLQKFLGLDPRIIPSPILYNVDTAKLYSSIMDRLAQPPGEGIESPFSSRNPLSGHGQLTGMLAHLLEAYAHEVNLMPNRALVQQCRLLGGQIADSEYPIVELTFRKRFDSSQPQQTVVIPIGTEVYSTRNLDVVATTTATIEIGGDNLTGSVPARLNNRGQISTDIIEGEFSVLPQLLSYVESVSNTAIIYAGREKETLAEAVLRIRQQIQIGLRCTTARDYYYTALSLGAQKINIVPGVEYPSGNYYSDLVSVIIYPGVLALAIQQTLIESAMIGTRVDAVPAEIIPIDGEITVRIVPSLTNSEVFEIVATAIADKVNPPYGNWGDIAFASTIATVLENEPASIYAVPTIKLKHAITGEPIEKLDIKKWNLLELQQSTKFNWIR